MVFLTADAAAMIARIALPREYVPPSSLRPSTITSIATITRLQSPDATANDRGHYDAMIIFDATAERAAVSSVNTPVSNANGYDDVSKTIDAGAERASVASVNAAPASDANGYDDVARNINAATECAAFATVNAPPASNATSSDDSAKNINAVAECAPVAAIYAAKRAYVSAFNDAAVNDATKRPSVVAGNAVAAASNAGASIAVTKNTYATAIRAFVATVNSTAERASVVEKIINAANEYTTVCVFNAVASSNADSSNDLVKFVYDASERASISTVKAAAVAVASDDCKKFLNTSVSLPTDNFVAAFDMSASNECEKNFIPTTEHSYAASTNTDGASTASTYYECANVTFTAIKNASVAVVESAGICNYIDIDDGQKFIDAGALTASVTAVNPYSAFGTSPSNDGVKTFNTTVQIVSDNGVVPAAFSKPTISVAKKPFVSICKKKLTQQSTIKNLLLNHWTSLRLLSP